MGEQTPDEFDITDARKIYRPESVGIGDYPMDSHAVRPKAADDTQTFGEGEWYLVQRTPWHQLPFGVCVPKKLDNVFVTTAVSSTHVSFGTYRMEPVRMAFGQAAGIAAKIAIQFHKTGREVPARQIQDELLPHTANPYGDPNIVLHYFSDVPPTHKYYRAIQYLASRGFLPDADSDNKFLPDKPVTPAELQDWLNRLGTRANPVKLIRSGKKPPIDIPLYAPSYMGSVKAYKFALLRVRQTATVNRADFLFNLWMVLQYGPEQGANPINPYTDVKEPPHGGNIAGIFVSQICILHECGIDSRLWDSWGAYAPDGRLRLQPNKPITRGEAFAAFYIAQIGLGPLFNDHPIDGVNGRYVPPAPKYTSVSVDSR